MKFYLLTMSNRVKQLYFSMIGSFDNSYKVVSQFDGETFVKQSVKLVPSVKLLLLKFCYQKSKHQEGIYMKVEISCLTVLARGSKIVSVYMVYLQGISHQFEISVINAFYNKF